MYTAGLIYQAKIIAALAVLPQISGLCFLRDFVLSGFVNTVGSIIDACLSVAYWNKIFNQTTGIISPYLEKDVDNDDHDRKGQFEEKPTLNIFHPWS